MKIPRALRWIAVVTALAAAALAAALLGAGYFLAAPAQPPVKADLLVSLGGDNGARVDRVLELYRQGYAPRVLLAGSEGARPKFSRFLQNLRARYLIEQGIPESALLYSRPALSSWEEALDTRELMRERQLLSALVVSDPPHLRRLAWVWGKVFDGSGKRITLVASDMDGWDPGGWWRTSGNAQFVFGEYIKLVYYAFQY